MRCPACNGKRIEKRQRYAMLYCVNCNTSFVASEGSPDEPAQAVPRKPGKSGVIAPPRQPQEWRPLKREPFAHAQLAMLARRG